MKSFRRYQWHGRHSDFRSYCPSPLIRSAICDFFSCPEQLKTFLSLDSSDPTNNQSLHNTTEWLQWLLIRGMRRHGLTKKYLPTYLPCTYLSSYRHLWPLRHLIRVMRRHDLTKNIYLPTYIPVQYLPVQLFAYLPPSENTLKGQS